MGVLLNIYTGGINSNKCVYCYNWFHRAHIVQHYKTCNIRKITDIKNIQQQKLELFMYIFNIDNISILWEYLMYPNSCISQDLYECILNDYINFWENKNIDFNNDIIQKFITICYAIYEYVKSLQSPLTLDDREKYDIPYYVFDYVNDNYFQIFFDTPGIIKDLIYKNQFEINGNHWYKRYMFRVEDCQMRYEIEGVYGVLINNDVEYFVNTMLDT